MQPVNNAATMAAVIEKVNKRLLTFSDNLEYTHLNFKNADQALRLEVRTLVHLLSISSQLSITDHVDLFQYYTWENQGYVTGNSLYPEICELLDQTFNVAANMTYNT